MPAPMAGKLLILPLRHSLLALAALTLLCFTFLALRSSPPYPTDLSPTTISAAAAAAGAASIYHSPEVFRLNYAEMERDFKVYIYPDGDPNTYYQTPRKTTGKYASEGFFFQNIRESRFLTEDPEQAHLFFIPVSCHKMRGKYHFSAGETPKWSWLNSFSHRRGWITPPRCSLEMSPRRDGKGYCRWWFQK